MKHRDPDFLRCVYFITTDPDLQEVHAIRPRAVIELLLQERGRLSRWPLDDHLSYRQGVEYWAREATLGRRLRSTPDGVH